MEITIGFPYLRNVSQHLAIIHEREAGILDTPVNRGLLPCPEGLAGNIVNPRIRSGIGMGNQH